MSLRILRRNWSFIAAAALGAFAAPAAAQLTTVTKAVLVTDALADGSTVTAVTRGVIGAGGHVLVTATIDSGTRNALLVGLPGGVFSAVARSGDSAPGTPAGVVFSTFLVPTVDGSGKVAFIGALTGAGVTAANDRGIWVHNGTSLVLVAREGDPAPGLPAGTTMTGVGNSMVFSNGRCAFVSGLAGGGVTAADDQALWSWSSGTSTLVVRKGATSVVAGVTWGNVRDVLINASGTLAFTALVNSGNTATDSVVVTRTAPLASLFLVAREGSAAPGTAAGIVFTNDFGGDILGQSRLSINNAGDVLFFGNLTGSGVVGSTATGIWRRTGASTTIVARAGDTAPGFPIPLPAQGSPQNAVLGGSGITAYDTTIDGTGFTAANDRQMYRRTNAAAAARVARESDPTGEPGGTIFGPGAVDYFFDYAVNASGRMLIEAESSGLFNGIGYYGNDPSINGGATYKVLRSGDLVGVSGVPGLTLSTASNFAVAAFGGTQQGLPSSLSDNGNAALLLSLSDGNVFRRGVFAVPVAPGAPTGACCIGSTCVLATAAACGAGSFKGIGIACNAAGNNASPCCKADYNQSGAVSVQDVYDFLTAWNAANSNADFNGIGGVSVQDVYDFFTAWNAGCP